MRPAPRPLRILAALAALAAALPGSAGAFELRPRFQPGDAYALSLRTTTDHDVRARAAGRAPHEEQVALAYTATVVVLETDASGTPTRERHEGAQLTYERPGETGALFRQPATFEVRRDGSDRLRLFLGEKRFDRGVEKVLTDVLASQLERGLEPALLAPATPVAAGDSWTLDPELARRLLRSHGVRVLAFDGAATATLEERPAASGELERVLRYRIPVERCEPWKMPPNAKVARSSARLEGEVRLAPGAALGRPLSHRAELVMTSDGVTVAPGVAEPVPWKLRTAKTTDQSTRILEREVASNL